MGVIYPIFFLACVVIAIAVYYVRSKGAHGVQQLTVFPDYNAVVDLVPNVTQQLLQQASGTYTPKGAA